MTDTPANTFCDYCGNVISDDPLDPNEKGMDYNGGRIHANELELAQQRDADPEEEAPAEPEATTS